MYARGITDTAGMLLSDIFRTLDDWSNMKPLVDLATKRTSKCSTRISAS